MACRFDHVFSSKVLHPKEVSGIYGVGVGVMDIVRTEQHRRRNGARKRHAVVASSSCRVGCQIWFPVYRGPAVCTGLDDHAVTLRAKSTKSAFAAALSMVQ